MGVGVLVLGHSGSGKSTSLRNFEPDEIGVFNVAGKPLPFRKHLPTADNSGYEQITSVLAQAKQRAYVIDDANYLMAFDSFKKAKQTGYGKFTEIAVNFELLLEAIRHAPKDTIVYVMMHPDYDDAGRMKPKSIGKMLDNQLCIEGLFSIVLEAYGNETGYHFRTNDPGGIAKSPLDMFEQPIIDNDLKAVDAAIREYWQLAPLGGDNNA